MSLVGTKLPEFKLDGVYNGQFKTFINEDFKGEWFVMFFYPLDFTFVCPTEINEFSDRVAEFKEAGAEVVAVSVDSKFSHLAWTNQPRNQGGIQGVQVPVLSDITKSFSKQLGVLLSDAGVTLRGLYIIDPDGVVQYETVHALGVGRSATEALRVLQALKHNKETGEVCPASWEKGKETINTSKPNEYFGKLK